MDDDDRDLAQQRLDSSSPPRPGEVYRHYKGGLYSIVCCSIMEDTLGPLVTYHSNLKGKDWTRTLANFREVVEVPSLDGLDRVRRFTRADR